MVRKSNQRKSGAALGVLLLLWSGSAFAQDPVATPETTISSTTVKAPPPYTASLSMLGIRGFDIKRSWVALIGASASYSILEKLTFSVGTSFSNTFTKFYDKNQNFVWSDTTLGVSSGDLIKTKLLSGDLSISPSLAIVLPTSLVSQSSSMRAAYSFGPDFEFSKAWFKFSYSPSFTLYDFEFDTADKMGTSPNPIYGFDNLIGLRFKLMKGLSLSTEGTYIFYKTYNLKGAAEDHINTDYQVRGGLSYSINEHISVSSRISTKDRTITQKQFFDQQTTNFSIGTSFNL